MSDPAIRRADAGDADALAALGARTFVESFGRLYPPADLEQYLAEAYDPKRLRAELSDPRRAAWLAEVAGAPVGYAQEGPCA
jgi:hypothetical protein